LGGSGEGPEALSKSASFFPHITLLTQNTLPKGTTRNHLEEFGRKQEIVFSSQIAMSCVPLFLMGTMFVENSYKHGLRR
jgi:hypothetical protein